MNTDMVQGKWKQLRGVVTRTCGRIIHDPMLVFMGDQDVVNGRIQERVGRTQAARIFRRPNVFVFRR